MAEEKILGQSWLEVKKKLLAGQHHYKSYYVILKQKNGVNLLDHYDHDRPGRRLLDTINLRSALGTRKRNAKGSQFAFEIMLSGTKHQMAGHSSNDVDKWLRLFEKVGIRQVDKPTQDYQVSLVDNPGGRKLVSVLKETGSNAGIALRSHMPVVLSVSDTHATLKRRDYENEVTSWHLSCMGPLTGQSLEQGDGIVTIKLDRVRQGYIGDEVSFYSLDYKEIIQLLRSKVDSLMTRKLITNFGNRFSRSFDDSGVTPSGERREPPPLPPVPATTTLGRRRCPPQNQYGYIRRVPYEAHSPLWTGGMLDDKEEEDDDYIDPLTELACVPLKPLQPEPEAFPPDNGTSLDGGYLELTDEKIDELTNHYVKIKSRSSQRKESPTLARAKILPGQQEPTSQENLENNSPTPPPRSSGLSPRSPLPPSLPPPRMTSPIFPRRTMPRDAPNSPLISSAPALPPPRSPSSRHSPSLGHGSPPPLLPPKFTHRPPPVIRALTEPFARPPLTSHKAVDSPSSPLSGSFHTSSWPQQINLKEDDYAQISFGDSSDEGDGNYTHIP
eukprot:m.4285 g.4285  ORF g.4285 m.4285 type:complete len:555 (+) comp10497_c0_seq2:94-1758(+)